MSIECLEVPQRTLELAASLAPYVSDGLSHPSLRFHTYDNHIAPGYEYLKSRWQYYKQRGVDLNMHAGVAAWFPHDHGIADPLIAPDISKEHRTAGLVRPELQLRGVEGDELELALLSILATNFSTPLDPEHPEATVTVQADLHNTFTGLYRGFAINTHRIHQEDEGLEDRIIPLDEHKQKVECVLGNYFRRGMGIVDDDYLESGVDRYSHIGSRRLKRFLDESPEDLAKIVGVPESELHAA